MVWNVKKGNANVKKNIYIVAGFTESDYFQVTQRVITEGPSAVSR